MLVRRDIPVAAQVVQAAHAALEAGFTFARPDDHPNLVLLSVPDEQALIMEHERLLDAGVPCAAFHEPDEPINGWTALATQPISDPLERRLFKRLPLWRA